MFARSAKDQCVPAAARTARILDLVATGQRANPHVPLLIHGEPGAGKDTLAYLIHHASPRRHNAFIKVNLAAPSDDRHDADLFGHERGVSSQAIRRRLGSFEFAHHGTLYLDGAGAAPPEQIARLVHAATTGEVSRSGGQAPIQVDVRLIASTADSPTARTDNDLWRALQGLGGVEICVEPLRERIDEIPVLATFFVEKFNQRYGRDVQLCADTLSAFMHRSWPGNIRELEEAVHRLFVGETEAHVR